ncbi:MAG: hypothetical protein DRJ96_02090 [Thermoprotei archaeon]|nr:MAG: hypothetical protein DRJ57_04880 [Thermoprotei archaeon]RLE98096.1 MAG: hypothetical protein DRJ96_02090 [Thermoprotei archaeon]
MRGRDLAVAALIAAMYAALVAALPMISFLLWQVRIADALLMLSTVLGWPAVVGVTLGCFIGNLTAPWGSTALILIDATMGSLANFVASYIAYKVAYRRGVAYKLAAAAIEVGVISVIVGSYLKYLLLWAFNVDLPLTLSILGVLPGSFIAIGVLGTALAIALEKRVT